MRVLRHEPHILPSVALAVIIGPVCRRKGVESPLSPTSFAVESAHKSRRTVKIFSIGSGPFHEQCVLNTQPCSNLGYGIVRYGILKPLGHTLTTPLEVKRYVAVTLQLAQRTLVEHGRCTHGLICPLHIIGQPLQRKVTEHDHSRIAYHAVSLVAVQMPHRQLSLLPEYIHESCRYIGLHLGKQQRIHRMRGPVSIPERKHAVSLLLIFCVTICHRCGHRMKQRRVQQPPVSIAGGRDCHAPEIIIPLLVGTLHNCVKISITNLCVKIGPGSLHTPGRKSHLGNKRLGRRGKHTQRKRVISLTSRHRP